MAFCMRLYICSGKVLLEGMCVRFSVCFHAASAVKASLPEASLIEKAAPFYGPERSELYESDSGPSVL